MSMKKISTILYPNISSANRHVLNGDGLPVPDIHDNFFMHPDEADSVSSNSE